MRIVLDTNVLVAAFVARGQCHELLEHVSRTHRLFTSKAILDEFREKLLDKIKAPPDTVEEAIELEQSRMEVVNPGALAEPVCRDPDDDAVLATALAAKADCLITGDGDLLDLETFQGILILQPADFWKHESRLGQRARRESADDQ